MKRSIIAFLAGLLLASQAVAQAPSPAQVGITPSTLPEVLQVLDSTQHWVPIGTVDPTTHNFAPIGSTGGPFLPLLGGTLTGKLNTQPSAAAHAGLNIGQGTSPTTPVNGDLWTTSAGIFGQVAGVTVGPLGVGSGGAGLPVTVYSNHANLIANAARPSVSAYTLYQQGFYFPGQGGAATYEWDATSFCPGNTTGGPATAAGDGIVCILPVGQSQTTAGRFRLQVPNGALDVRLVGMVPYSGTGAPFDNATIVPALMNALGVTGGSGGYDVVFSGTLGQTHSSYYFASPFVVSSGMHIYCVGGQTSTGSVILAFAPGVDGVIQEDPMYVPAGVPAGQGAGTIDGCNLTNIGMGYGIASHGTTSITSAHFVSPGPAGLPEPIWNNGDAILNFPYNVGFGPPVGNIPTVYNGSLAVPPVGGTYVNPVSPGSYSLTLQGLYTVHPQFGSASALFRQGTDVFQNGETMTLGTSVYHFVDTLGSTPGNVLRQGYQVVTWTQTAQNLVDCVNNNVASSTCVPPTNPPQVTADALFAGAISFWAKTGGVAGNSLASIYSGTSSTGGAFDTSFGGGTHFINGSDAPAAFGFFQLPATQKYTVQTTAGDYQVLVKSGPRRIETGDVLWSDAFPIWTSVTYDWAAVQFIEAGTNNFNLGDKVTVGSNIYTFVNPIGSTPGNVLIGANFAASAANLAGCVNNNLTNSTCVGTFGGPTTAQVGTLPSNNTINFVNRGVVGPPGSSKVSTYTPNGTSAGSFDHSNFADQMVYAAEPFLGGANQNATQTEAAGQLWVVPALLKRHITAYSHRMTFDYGPIGMQMPCTGHIINCDFSGDSDNIYSANGIGRYDAGNNYSGSGSTNEYMVGNFFGDLAELGPLGVSYTNLNSHSGESGTSFANILVDCISENSSAFYGGYYGGSSYPACANHVGLLPPTIGPAPLYISPLNLVPTGSPYIQGTVLGGGNWQSQSAGGCVALSGGPTPYNLGWYSFGFAYPNCITGLVWGWGWDPATKTWDLDAGITQIVERYVTGNSNYYTGGVASAVSFPYGVLVGAQEDGAHTLTDARLISTGPVKPAATWHQQGDVQFNILASVGGPVGWINASAFQTTLSANVIAGTTTSVAIGQCPPATMPNGTPVYDAKTFDILPVLLGLYSNCSNPGGAGTLTFTTSTATGSGLSGETIRFLIQEAVGLVDGTLPAAVTTGSCSGSGLVGGVMYGGTVSGTFVAPLCSASNFIISSLPSAPNGWDCHATDRTTPADLLNQAATGNSTTAAKFNATTAASDVIGFTCNPY